MEWLAACGGSLRVEQTFAKDGYRRRTLYRWRLLAQVEVAEFLKMVMPYLRVKRERAEEILLALERAA